MNQQQVREQSPQQERPRSFWQRYRASGKSGIISVLVTILALGSLFFTIFFIQKSQPQQQAHVSTTLTPDDIVKEVLVDENTNGWDDKNQGILINWRRDDVSKVNCSPTHCDVRGQSTNHDSANDLRDLENLYWYQARHPGDTSMTSYIARILPTVKREWGQTTMAKGWIYYLLLRLSTYSADPTYWNNTIQNWVEAQYKGTDPVLGVHHGPVDITSTKPKITAEDGYRVDHDLELGLALVDAGTRYHHPEWVTAGRKEVSVVIQQSYSTTYHLFNRIYVIHDPKFASNKVLDTQARMGENGQEIEALLRAGLYTKTNSYVQLAKEMLDSLETLPIRDHVHGGFHFKIYLGPFQGHEAGYVDTSMKETRQLHMLPALILANRAFNNRYASLTAELLHMATTPHKLFQPAPVPGYSYQVLPDGQLFPCRTCSPNPTENWVTSEADSIGVEGLQVELGDKSMPN